MGGENQDLTSGESEQKPASRAPVNDDQKLHARLHLIQHRIIVLSGKGGVGKSTVAVNLAATLAGAGKQVGLLDVDIHGPSVPTMLGLEGSQLDVDDGDIVPVRVGDLKILSIGFLLQNPDEALIWRGPLKMKIIRQFLQEANWGSLDYLIVDAPPGTGDEPLSICQLLGDLDGALVVTTPQRVAAIDVRKAITFCRSLKVPVLGVIENMSAFACPWCGKTISILPSGGGRKIADDMDVPFLGSIPIDPAIADACDHGKIISERWESSPGGRVMREIIANLLNSLNGAAAIPPRSRAEMASESHP